VMKIRGWLRTSLIEYPGQVATVLFTGGCNFRCPMCHNVDLVLRPDTLPIVPEALVWTFLEKRTGKVTGLVVSGGEPTVQPDLVAFLQRARDRGVALKLDTNGYRPRVLAAVLEAGLVDYVAMDIKAPPEKYALLSGLPCVDVGQVAQSVALVMDGGVPYEFRTTVVPGLLNLQDIESLAKWIAGADRYVLQQFRAQRTLVARFADVQPYDRGMLVSMSVAARNWVREVRLR
jgi:pyruvate formate lyase activating enzyme